MVSRAKSQRGVRGRPAARLDRLASRRLGLVAGARPCLGSRQGDQRPRPVRVRREGGLGSRIGFDEATQLLSQSEMSQRLAFGGSGERLARFLEGVHRQVELTQLLENATEGERAGARALGHRLHLLELLLGLHRTARRRPSLPPRRSATRPWAPRLPPERAPATRAGQGRQSVSQSLMAFSSRLKRSRFGGA